MLHKYYQFAISICEVSGPNFKTNRNHIVGDRNKSAKNMRAILNHIEKTSPTANQTKFKKIKLYSFQVYLNNLYIYSLRPLGNGYSVFVLEKTISITVSLPLLKSQLPVFLGWLWNINPLMKESIASIENFINTSREEEVFEVDSQPNSNVSSQESVRSVQTKKRKIN